MTNKSTKIDWVKIRKEFPRAFLLLCNWNMDTDLIDPHQSLDEILDTYRPSYFRELYDFFDENEINIMLCPLFLSNKNNSFQWCIRTKINGKLGVNEGECGDKASRRLVERHAFEQAFSILEMKILSEIHE